MKHVHLYVICLLAALCLAALPVAAEEAFPAFEEEITAQAVEPDVAPAQSAGIEGLEIEVDGDAGFEIDFGDSGAGFEGEIGVQAVEPAPELELELECEPEEGATLYDVDATPLDGGYVAVAAGTTGYADAALTQPLGEFTGDTVAWAAGSAGSEGEVLLRFDTAEGRDWGDPIVECYASEADLLPLTEAEETALVGNIGAIARREEGVLLPTAAYAADASNTAETVLGPGVASHTQAEIQAFVDAHPAFGEPDIYRVGATRDPYAPYKLSEYTMNHALNMVNQVRYIAGVDANVTLDWDMEDDIAAGPFLNGLNKDMDHFPERPGVLADSAYDELYRQGFNGASSSNLYSGPGVVGEVLGYVSDANNVQSGNVGHRNWVLFPWLGKTMFGSCSYIDPWLGSGAAMYVFDRSGAGGQQRVAWPAQQTPVQYFHSYDNWSIARWYPNATITSDGWYVAGYGETGTELAKENITVTVVRQSDGKTWRFSSEASDGFFAVEYDHVIFHPDGLDSLSAGDAFNVTARDALSGETVRYIVNFFELDLSKRGELDDYPDTLALIRDDGIHVTWDAAGGATGYFLCRAVNDGGLAVYKTLAASQTSYVDKEVSEDATYTYCVYPFNDYRAGYGSKFTARLPVADEVRLNETGTLSKLIYNDDAKTPITVQLTATVYPSYAETELTWTSSNTKVAKVDGNGLVTPVGEGTTTITVSTDNGKTASVDITYALPVPYAVYINQYGLSLETYSDKEKTPNTVQLTASVYPGYAPTTLTWTSSDTKVAKVDKNGLVTPVGEGTATITVSTHNGITDTVDITYTEPKPSYVYINEGYRSMETYSDKARTPNTLQLTARVYPDYAPTTLTWTSSDTRVAKVDSNGLVTSVGEGTATITVSADNGVKDTLDVSFALPKPRSISIDQHSMSLETYSDKARTPNTVQLTAAYSPDYADTTLTWTSSDTKVARVDSNGLVTPVGEGTVTITVATDNGMMDSIQVKYTVPKPTSVILQASEISLSVYEDASKAAETFQLSASVKPDYVDDSLTWTSSDTEVARVDKNGLVTAVGKGTATITVSTSNKVKASASVKVNRVAATTAKPTVTPKSTVTPMPTVTPKSTVTPMPTVTPKSTVTPKPTIAPTATSTAIPIVAPTKAPTPTGAPAPTSAPAKTRLTKARITVKAQTYTGKAVKPSVTVKLNGKTLKKGTDYTVSYKNNKAVGKATVVVKGKGKYTGTVKKAFRINPKKVSGLKLKAGTKRITATWKKVSGATGYQIEYGLKKDFKGAKKVTVKKGKTVKATLKKLKAKKTYYVRIRSYKTVKKVNYYSKWSKVVKCKAK